MSSMTSQTQGKAQYYSMQLKPSFSGRLLHTNAERAFVLSELQRLLEMRSLLEDAQAHHRLASHIDLLAFSVLPDSVELVLFAVSPASVVLLGQIISQQIIEFRTTQEGLGRSAATYNLGTPAIHTGYEKLSGPHHALALTTRLHLKHTDWESDRYCSSGFYLHDRRGSWMRIWRLSHLYDNDPGRYRILLTGTRELFFPEEDSLYYRASTRAINA